MSKSEERRMAVQRVPGKVTQAGGVPVYVTVDTLAEITARLDKVETDVADVSNKTTVLIKGLEWAAKEIKPMFGVGVIGAVFEQLAEKVKG